MCILEQGMTATKKYLHQSFRVIARPLIEVSSLFETTQAREWRRESNSMMGKHVL